MQSTSAYVHSDSYFHAIDRLETIVRSFDPADPDMVRTSIIEVLGDDLGVWPMTAFTGVDEGDVVVLD